MVSADGAIIATYPKKYKKVKVIETTGLLNMQIGDQSLPVMVKKYNLKRTPKDKLSGGVYDFGGGSYSTSEASIPLLGWPEERDDTIYIISPNIREYIPKGRNDFFVPAAPIIKFSPRDLRYGLEGWGKEFSSTFNVYVTEEEKMGKKDDKYREVEFIGHRMLVRSEF